MRHHSYGGGDVPMCSAANRTGVGELYRRLRLGVRHHTNNKRHRLLRNLPNQQRAEADAISELRDVDEVARLAVGFGLKTLRTLPRAACGPCGWGRPARLRG